jgi:hypothetical protein
MTVHIRCEFDISDKGSTQTILFTVEFLIYIARAMFNYNAQHCVGA